MVEVIGKPVTEAIERCEISPVYFYAMRAVRESGDPLLYQAVLEGHESLFTAAARVKNAAAAIKAYRKCSLFEQGMVWLATGATTDLATMLWHSTPEQLVKGQGHRVSCAQSHLCHQREHPLGYSTARSC